jgi:hypothetical protein
MVVALFILPMNAGAPEIERALVPWHPLAALGTGTYVNFQGSATASDVAAAYPSATYRRPAVVKGRYDPQNRFAGNHNVEPALPGRTSPAHADSPSTQLPTGSGLSTRHPRDRYV